MGLDFVATRRDGVGLRKLAVLRSLENKIHCDLAGLLTQSGHKNLAIEVVHKSPKTAQRLERIARLIDGQERWELRVISASPTSAQPALEVQKSRTLKKRIEEVKELARNGHPGPALLLAWATFEALARAAAPGQFESPQTPGRLVQVLANGGYLTPSEADQLRQLAEKRNKLVHGGLQVRND